MQNVTVSASYLEKQKNFRSLVKEIQTSLKSKEYVKEGYSFNEYVKMKWNISQAQAYRYLLCAKVLDQLEEFEIQPSYERVCNALFHTVKTPSQMKLLWSVILQKAGTVPESINSTHIKKIWKEICMNDKYSHICQSDENIAKKIEHSLTKFSVEKKHKQMKQMAAAAAAQQMNNTTVLPFSYIPSPVLSEASLASSNQSENQLYNIPLSPEYNNDCSSIIYNSLESLALPSAPSTETLYSSPSSETLYSSPSTESLYTSPSTDAIYSAAAYSAAPSTENLYFMIQPSEIQYQPQQIIYYY